MARKKKKLFSGVLGVLLPLVFICAGVLWWMWSQNVAKDATDKGIEYILRHTNSAGNLVDLTGDIGVKSIEDIRLYVKTDEVRIEYGKVLLTFTLEDFLGDAYTVNLERIGITRQINEKTGLLEVFYHGVLLERWAS